MGHGVDLSMNIYEYLLGRIAKLCIVYMDKAASSEETLNEIILIMGKFNWIDQQIRDKYGEELLLKECKKEGFQ
jgi:hypothetical protein